MMSMIILRIKNKMTVFLKQFSWYRLLESVLQVFGILWLLIEMADYFLSDPNWSTSIRSCWWLFCLGGLAFGVVRAWPRQSVSVQIKGTDVFVEVRIGDIFKLRGGIIVGSNTTFDTAMDDGTISSRSIQGQFSTQYFTTITDLDRQLDDALVLTSPTSTRIRAEKQYGKLKVYKMGTVAPIKVGDKKAYFVAIARLNVERVASSDVDSFLDALPVMWNELRNKGGMENLLCPVLGSRYSRLQLTRNELIQEIVRSFVAATHEGKLSEKLTVVIYPQDVKKSGINLKDLHQFLKCECIYTQVPRASVNSTPTGTPIQN